MISNNKRIAKNTVFLYFRMMLTLFVGLYTSRLIFNALGIEDYGIYNIVAGVVTMFSFINGAMSSATQRFLAYEIGVNDNVKLNNTFKMCVNIHLIISVIIIILCETIGLWFLNTKLNISPERLDAANWVYQCAMLGLVLTIMNVPYNANIIAHEKMQAFAYISILDVTLKLSIAYMLYLELGDNLKLYAISMLIVNFIIWICYFTYNKIFFVNSKYGIYWDSELFKVLTSYTGWNLFGNLSSVAANQGINITLNLFFGPTVNASRAVAYQINGAIVNFITNLQMAINPQIIKNYSTGKFNEVNGLVFKGAKYSFFLLYLIALPILLKTDEVLKLWLGNVPDYAVIFCRLALIDALIVCWSGGLMAAIQATGKIKLYQLIVGGVLLLNIPLSYLILSLYNVPYYVFFVSISLSMISLMARLVFVNKLNGINILSFIDKVIWRSLIVVLSTIILISLYYPKYDGLLFDLIVTTIYTSTIVIFCIVTLGLDSMEKSYCYKFIKKSFSGKKVK